MEPELAADVAAQLDALHAAETAPFEGLIADYAACLRQNRELEVRLASRQHAMPSNAHAARGAARHARGRATEGTPRPAPRATLPVVGTRVKAGGPLAPARCPPSPRPHQVRVAQLDKEAAELRDEVGAAPHSPEQGVA